MERLEEIYSQFLTSAGVSTDTREELKDKIFFALKGPNFNGNQYASEAIDRGAKLAIVDEEAAAEHERCVFVENTLSTLQALGSLHRKKLGLTILGITGSNGKTTNKELIYSIFSLHLKCFATKGNLNNHIGVPLSLLSLNETHELAIIEMGASGPGDIKELCEIADPDIGYITNIGLAHLEGFGSKGAIAKEKGELFRHVMEKGGKIFVNDNQPILKEIASGYEQAVFVGESESVDYSFTCLRAVPNVEMKYKEQLIESSLYGQHNYENIKMAAAIAMDLGVELDIVKRGISSYQSTNNRSQIINKRGIKIYMDAYNANPDSMKASIQTFREDDCQNKILILGDMLELGNESYDLHHQILNFVRESHWKAVFMIGKQFGHLQNSFSSYYFFDDYKLANKSINGILAIGDCILVKGSRGLTLEKLEFIQK